MKIKHKILIRISIFILFSIITAGIVSATDVYVYPEDSIQDAVKNASSGDTIIVSPGTYAENIEVNKSVTIKSKSGNPNDTIIRAANPGNHIFHVTASNVAILGFTITGAFEEPENRYFPDAGINVSTFNETTGKDEVVYSSEGQWFLIPKNWAGIYIDNTDDTTIKGVILLGNNRGILLNSSSNNLLENNTAINNDGAISIWEFSNSNIVRNNNISADETYRIDKYGISLKESDGNEVSNNNLLRLDMTLLQSDANKIVNNTINLGGIGITLIESNKNELSLNSISTSSTGIFLRENSGFNKLTDNAISDNFMGIKLQTYSNNNTISKNTLNNNEDIYYSDDSNNNEISENNIDYGKYLKRAYDKYVIGVYRGYIVLISISVFGMIYLFFFVFRK
ncbi:Cell surface protein [Methanosarcina siciliae C2J]|uniref:Cell surface protein n=1 Tax=Methanosarcina siciliae C2J TaxID=1434118 RepID=A0A0E3LDU8_9EURY|nr:NosD domain-containing protein [Methanosarcina siciliae]AKB37896.1 Cell surface protein [Methanosarcina siciliae C2J]